jgi:hypothetical protein
MGVLVDKSPESYASRSDAKDAVRKAFSAYWRDIKQLLDWWDW